MIAILPYICVFAFGAAAGSFIDVCVYRIPRNISIIRPRSYCPACGKTLTARELIPLVSYIILRGKCASCDAPIHLRHTLSELICGFIWIALLWKFSFSFQFVCYAALCSIFIAIFFIDLYWMRIPNILVVCAIAPAFALCVRYVFFLSPPERFRSAYNSINGAEPLLGMIPCALFLIIYIVSALTRGGEGAVGMGDIKLLIPMGAALGLRQNLLAVFIAIMLGGLTGVALIISGKKSRKDPIPFGPFLVAGAVAAIIIPVSYII